MALRVSALFLFCNLWDNEPEMVICGDCQTSNSPKARFCVKCGANLRPQGAVTQTQPAISPPTAAEAESPAKAETKGRKKGVAVQEDADPSKLRKIDELLQREAVDAPLVPGAKAQPQIDLKAMIAPEAAPPASISPGSDLAPLLAEEHRQLSEQIRNDPDTDTPVHLWLNFPRAFVAGYGSIIDVKLENPSPTPLDMVDVILESTGLEQRLQVTCRRIPPAHSHFQSIEFTPAKPGNYVFRSSVMVQQNDQRTGFRGRICVPIRIHAVPDNSNLVVNISDIQCVRGGGANTGLGQEFGSVNISNLLPAGTIRTLNDLLDITFPQAFGKVPLELDYEVSQYSIDPLTDQLSYTIPKKFLAHVQTGTELRLEPVDDSKNILPLHLVARDEFKLGRSRELSDFVTWFWPRSAENDDRTRRISKIHAIAETHGDKLVLRDYGSTNRATFEGHALSEDQNDVIDQRGTLILGHEYHLDVSPFESTMKNQLVILNERLWSGPPQNTTRSGFGSVRFMPVNSGIGLFNTVWLLTDANFGCSNVNPIVLELPGVSEVHGRFHYYRQNFWIEALPGGAIAVDDYKIMPRDIVPLANGTRVQIGETVFRATVLDKHGSG